MEIAAPCTVASGVASWTKCSPSEQQHYRLSARSVRIIPEGLLHNRAFCEQTEMTAGGERQLLMAASRRAKGFVARTALRRLNAALPECQVPDTLVCVSAPPNSSTLPSSPVVGLGTGVGVSCAPINSVAQLLPHTRASGVIVD
jgi:hypothetical protein